ncbi:MAG: phosphate acyltransferase PlsX [Desulfovibrionaceae bacterium]
MKKDIIIAVDAMGGDVGPSVIVAGAIEVAKQHDFVKIIFVGDKNSIQEELEKNITAQARFEVVHAEEVALMSEKPAEIVRKKKSSSIYIACQLVKEGKADAFVSAGHSGAAVACGMFIIGRLKGVDRPALAGIMPTEKNPFIFLDLGANVDCSSKNLLQFALMGDKLARNLLEYQDPRVAILSIGEEEGKGNILTLESYALLKNAKGINFVGNIEGKDLFTGEIDVVVCDGFVGNIALKLSEGLSSSIRAMLKKYLSQDILSRIGGVLSLFAFRRFKKHTDYAEYGGALLVGLKKVGIVAHGRSNQKAIQSATQMAVTLVAKETCEQLEIALAMNQVDE